MAADTVEFGDSRDRARRFRLPVPNVSATALAAVLATLGFAFALGAELLPWLNVTTKGEPPVQFGQFSTVDDTMRLTQLVVWQAPAYYLTMTGLLALTAVTLLGRQTARHGIAAAALGCAAGQAVLLAGLLTATREGGDFTGTLSELRDRDLVELATGLGFYSAAGAVILLAGAAAVGGWASFRRRPAPANEPGDIDGQPLDFVVIPVDSFERPAGKL